MGGLFGIGTYQSITGGTVLGGGFPTTSFQLDVPYAGLWGGQYGYVLDTRVRAPKDVQYTPAPVIGLDGTGAPVVRGYPQMAWLYSELRSDYYYYLVNTYRQSARTPAAFQYLVLLQYPDLSGAEAPVQVLARMETPTHAYRQVGAFMGVQLLFSYLGQQELLPAVPIVTLS